jgi:N-acetylglucosamine-6-phosphate deacetylase
MNDSRARSARRTGHEAASVRRDGALVVRHGTVVLPDGLLADGQVVCEDGVITSVRRGAAIPPGARVVDAGGGFITPGFVDLHVHGGAGADFMDGTPEAVRTVLAAHARHGTTALFATTTVGRREQIDAMLDACRAVRDAWRPEVGARLAGVHLYGPYFAAGKTGCHAAEARRDPAAAEYDRWFRDGLVRIATCAAELPGAVAFYRAARRRGCLVTCGHSNASWSEMVAAFRAGMRHVDHFWCAMSSVPSLRARFGAPMQASMEQFVLAEPAMSTEVIADGQHLAPELLAFALRMKGADRVCLVTDSSRALDMPAGRYRFGSEADGPWFESDGAVGRVGDALASSVAGMDHMVRTMVRSGGATLVEAVRMAALTPAERSGIAAEAGSIVPGKRADLVILSRRLACRHTIIGGRVWAG